MTLPHRQDAHGITWPLALIAVAGVALFFAKDISRVGFANNDDPGPRWFPIVLSLCLLAGGVFELGRWAWRQRAGRGLARRTFGLARARRSFADRGNQNVLLMGAALALYLPALIWIGFSLSTLLLAIVIMIRLGTTWWLAVIVSCGMIAVVHVLFVTLFKVQLPGGVLGLPW